MSPRVKANQVMLFKRGMDMATGKNKKGKARSGGSQASARHSGLEALESRMLFAAAPLVGELSGPKSADDGAASIEVALLPGDKLGADAGQTNGLVPTPPGEAQDKDHKGIVMLGGGMSKSCVWSLNQAASFLRPSTN